jgi:outer membrane protein
MRPKISWEGNEMRRLRWLVCLFAFISLGGFSADAQTGAAQAQAPASAKGPALKVAAREKGASSLPSPEGFQNFVVAGKLTLSLDDAIRLALENNTNVRLDHTQIENAQYAVISALAPFDPLLSSSFNAFRQVSQSDTTLAGAPKVNSLSQLTQVGITQTLETGTNYSVLFNANKSSTNDSFNTFNPAYASFLSFEFTQPLLRGAGLFINRAPILIAQKNLAQSRDNFESEVNDTILNVVGNYWNVVQARENLVVQRESLDEAQKSYDHDKKSLELGALPPLDIYRSESQVASRRVSVIQAEYGLKQAEDQFRQVVGADIDQNIRAYELDLTEKADPPGTLMAIDIPTAMDAALKYRPELEGVRHLLAADDMNVRLMHNGLLPNLSLSGIYQTNGLGGNQINNTVSPPVITPGGFGNSVSQLFAFGYPGYGFTVSLTVPVRNHAAEANYGEALASKRHDLYSERQIHEQITLNVTNAVHQLEQAKQSMEAAKIALDLSQKTLQADQHKYDLGAETIFFVLEAQTELTAAEQTLLQAEVSYQLAVAQVDHETGGLLDRFHVQIANLSK